MKERKEKVKERKIQSCFLPIENCGQLQIIFVQLIWIKPRSKLVRINATQVVFARERGRDKERETKEKRERDRKKERGRERDIFEEGGKNELIDFTSYFLPCFFLLVTFVTYSLPGHHSTFLSLSPPLSTFSIQLTRE